MLRPLRPGWLAQLNNRMFELRLQTAFYTGLSNYIISIDFQINKRKVKARLDHRSGQSSRLDFLHPYHHVFPDPRTRQRTSRRRRSYGRKCSGGGRGR